MCGRLIVSNGAHRRRDADVGVAEEFLDDGGIEALPQEHDRGRVSEIVETDRPESPAAEEVPKGARPLSVHLVAGAGVGTGAGAFTGSEEAR